MNRPDIKTQRLTRAEYVQNFGCDILAPLDMKTARIEAQRCYFCHDAPCITACPTDIDVPGFIRKISTSNVTGAARTILSENILGGTCARVCPVESLCEGACVRNHAEDKPVAIGQLQKFATDQFFALKEKTGFIKATQTGKKVAVVGAGPAGLSCAHRLSLLGHKVVIFEAKAKAGGLNEYGIAAYKMVDDFAKTEVDFILQDGNIELKTDQQLGRNLSLRNLQIEFDAVFLAFGLAGVNDLGLKENTNESMKNVVNAVDYIALLRQAKDLGELPVGRRVVVIGGGSTAIDIAIQSKRLGAETVTLVYRRGEDQMSATWKERELAQKNGVLIKTWAKPSSLRGDEAGVQEVEFEYTASEKDKLVGTGEYFVLQADMVFKAIGQNLLLPQDATCETIETAKGKIKVDEKSYHTSVPGVFAGGDCVFDKDLTVVAVRQGKKAAHSIDAFLREQKRGKNG